MRPIGRTENKINLPGGFERRIRIWSRANLRDLFPEQSLLYQRSSDNLGEDYRPSAFWPRSAIHVQAAFATNRFSSSVMVHST